MTLIRAKFQHGGMERITDFADIGIGRRTIPLMTLIQLICADLEKAQSWGGTGVGTRQSGCI